MKLAFGTILAAVLAFSTHLASAAGNARADVVIINNSPVTVVEIYTSATESKRYGTTDLLADGVIPSGKKMTVNFDVADAGDECSQDVLAKGADGRKWNWRMNVCKVRNWTLTD